MNAKCDFGPNKVPAITQAFWVIKIAATTLGEKAGDALPMTMDLGYAVSTVVLLLCFAAAVTAQVKAKSFHPFLNWATIVATTTVGTTMADFTDRSLGVGYIGGSMIIFVQLMFTIGLWIISTGSVSVGKITTPRVEVFYWVTFLFSNTLGTALGDFLADTSGLGYDGGALVFGAALMIVAIAYLYTKISHTALFWAAFILTRPLGAKLGEILTKPHESGRLDLR